MHQRDRDMTLGELQSQQACELPSRDLLLGISLLGIPLLGLDGITVDVDTSGPGWLISG